jgi:hypothetical protein
MRVSCSLFLHLILIVFSCVPEKKSGNVGDISFDELKDDPSFKICNSQEIFQYYNFDGVKYKGDKNTLRNEIFSLIKADSLNRETGYLTIRFIVNCEGKTGMFRIQEMDAAYKATQFSDKTKNHLLSVTKRLNGWKKFEFDPGKGSDYYQYLTFKLEEGVVKEILP